MQELVECMAMVKDMTRACDQEERVAYLPTVEELRKESQP